MTVLRQIVSLLIATAFLLSGNAGAVVGAWPGLRDSGPALVQASSATAGAVVSSHLVLHEGLTVERAMKGGETQQFTFDLQAHQFLNLRVEQEGIDVEVKLLGPDGKEAAWMDGLNGDFGPEEIAVVAGQGGTYTLSIACGNPKAAPAHYELKVLAVRNATSVDVEHTKAQQALAKGLQLMAEGTAESRAEAVRQFESAAPFFASHDEPEQQALTLYSIAFTYANSSEFRKALTYLPQSLELFRQTRDRNMEANALTLIGGADDVLGNLAEATSYYRQALAMAQADHNRGIEASILNNIGKIYHDLGDWQKSLQYYHQALPIFSEIGDRPHEANVLSNIGNDYYNLGDAPSALDYFGRALVIRKSIGDKDGQAYTLTGIANVLAFEGNIDEAIQRYNDALALRKAVGDKRAEAETLDYLGTAYSKAGHLQEALASHEQALELRKETADARGQALSLANLGEVYLLTKQPERSSEYERQALEIFRKIGDTQGIAGALQVEARAERESGQLDPAKQHIEQALSIIEEQRSRVSSEDLRESYFALSHDAYVFYIDLLMQLHRLHPEQNYDRQALEVSERARARTLLELLGGARANIHQGVDPALAEKERELGQLLDAKAARLTQSLGAPESSPELQQLKAEINQLENEYQDVRAAIRKSSPQYADLTQPHVYSVEQIQKQVLDPKTMLLEYSLGPQSSYVWAVSKTSVHSYELPSKQNIEHAARTLYERVSVPERRGTGAENNGRESVAYLSAQLSRMILAPVSRDMRGMRLVVVPDGALQYIPFAMLPSPDQGYSAVHPLVGEHEIVTSPSISVLAVHRNELKGRSSAPDEIAVLADPVFSTSDPRVRKSDVARQSGKESTIAQRDATRLLVQTVETQEKGMGSRFVIPRLPFTRQEAQSILAVAPGHDNFEALGFKANRELVLSNRLSRYRYVHFATHGYLDSEQPELSAIVLSMVNQQGEPEDGFLRLHDIYNLRMPADLVVLSACQTGLGKEIKGEGLVGLTRGFMYAGAARVVVSVWSVSDKATAELMSRFYTKILTDHLAPAEALRAAQLSMMYDKTWSEAYYWAGFVIQGDWR